MLLLPITKNVKNILQLLPFSHVYLRIPILFLFYIFKFCHMVVCLLVTRGDNEIN